MVLQSISLAPLMPAKKLFFASDFHLVYQTGSSMQQREHTILAWLEAIESSAQALFLLGDIFDFWFEYKYVIPKGFVRLQRKLASFVERGIIVYFLPGNHDAWIKNYLAEELGFILLHGVVRISIDNVKICIGHGDGWGSSEGYLFIKKYIYEQPILKWLARQLPPDLLFSTALYLVNRRKIYQRRLALSKDYIFDFCKNDIHPYQPHDYYIFGHLHWPYYKPIDKQSMYFSIGDWIHHFSYLVYDEKGCQLIKFSE